MQNRPSPAALKPMNSAAEDTGSVAILLCTFNGGNFIREQLDSIAAQCHQNWVVYASDDGSSDETLDILRQYQHSWGEARLLLSEGPRSGFSNNFLKVLQIACGHHAYYAFCDQDDLWHCAKLERALNWLEQQPDNTPALYCGRTRVIDSTGNAIGMSPLFRKRPSFENALMQSLAGGNTMVINQALCDVLKETPANTPLVCHDWWAYLLATGCGGNVCYDPVPMLDYRQHDQNVIGANTSLKNRLSRVSQMLKGSLREWNSTNIAALNSFLPRLTSASSLSLRRFEQARNASLITRIKLMVSSRFYRQTLFGNLGLALAILTKRI
nr:glycosyltransferase family 2 protein [uncultured Pseudomonas sp.]